MLYSYVVRVKPSELIDVSTDTMMFQFQYGTIKTILNNKKLCPGFPLSIPTWYD